LDDDSDSFSPRYPGIAGGRLRGQQKKVEEAVTGDLQFSMKAILGALVLSLGMDNMWNCIGPLFEEVLLLDPAELRKEFKEISTICRHQ
jgi:hypothetical protein